MTFWTSKNVATQKSFNFFIEIATGEKSYNLWEAKSVKLPSFGKEIITDQYGREIVNSEGPNQWNAFTIDIYDLVGISYTSPTGLRNSLNRNTWKWDSPNHSTSYSILQWLNTQSGFEEILSDEDAFNNRWEIKYVPATITIMKVYTNQKTLKDAETEQQDKMYVNEWIITDPIIESVEFGTMDYSSEEPVMVSITFRPKKPESVVIRSRTI